MEKECQYCGKKEKVELWIPAGYICTPCRKNIQKIRKYKLGIPKVKTHNKEK